MQRENPSAKLAIGSPLPKFSLPNVDGSTVSESYFAGAAASLVVFSCNHCPYVKGSDEMLLSTIRTFQSQGLKAVIVSANDAVQYPEDGLEKMKVKAATSNLPCPYLYDESQIVARTFDAQCTPECYLFDKNGMLAFHGAVNDSPKDSSKVSKEFLSAAIRQVLAGEQASPSYAHPIGCSIKWKIAV